MSWIDRRNLPIAVVASAIGLLLSFQNCTEFKSKLSGVREPSSTDSDLSSHITAVISPNYTFSTGFVGPNSKEGAFDSRILNSASESDARYGVMKAMGLGYRQYNLFWNYFESDTSPASSATPLNCPVGTQMVPPDAASMAALGFHKYRCLNSGPIAQYDDILSRDQSAGFQSGGVIYDPPTKYRYEGCLGFNSGGTQIYIGCVPRDDAMDDFEDFINFAASRWNGGGHGKLSHFIMWNENASPDWFDYTPITGKADLSTAAVGQRIDKLVAMLGRGNSALLRHQHQALLYVSSDPVWLPKPTVYPGHFGTKALVDGVWARVGTSFSWSLAVHPYGQVDAAPSPGMYSFYNLGMVANYLKKKLTDSGVTDPTSYPQYYMIASEQGWPLSLGRREQAREICMAHNKALQMPQLVAVANNYFHSIEANEDSPGAVSGQGAFYGLIPYSIPNSLQGVEATDAGGAYFSTRSAAWGLTDGHYCCQNFQLGCSGNPPPPAPPQPVPPPPAPIGNGVTGDGGTHPIYRLYNAASGDHFFTLTNGEGASLGYVPEGGFTAFNTLTSSRFTLYRCQVLGNHFVSLGANCEGQIVEGILGYSEISATAAAPNEIVRCISPISHQHLASSRYECAAAGMNFETTLGYTP